MANVSYRVEGVHEVATGYTVLFFDSLGHPHEAIVTSVFDRGDGHTPPAVNVVYASPDESKTDQYGRQVERETSVVHRVQQAAHGMYWTEAHGG